MNFKLKSLLFISFAALTLQSCTTFHPKKEALNVWPEQELLAKEFAQAKNLILSNKKISCEKFSVLSQNEKFLLKDFSKLYFSIHCEKNQSSEFINIDQQNKPWLSELYAEALLQNALRLKNPEKLAQAFIEKTKLSTQIKEKAQFSRAAYQFARQSQNQNLIKESEDRLYRTAPRLQKNPAAKEWYRIGQDFLLNRDFTKARLYFKKIVQDKRFSSEEKYQAMRLIRNSYKIEQKKQEHIAAARKLVLWLKKSENLSRLHDAYLTLARAEWTEGDLQKAKKTLALATKELRGQYPLDEIYWIYGRMDEESGNFTKAIENYKIAYNETKNSSAMKEKILFQMAWSLRKVGQFEESAIHFAELQKLTTDPFSIPRYQYWEAMSWKSANQEETSTALLKKLTQDDPLGFYGLISYHKLGAILPPLPIENESATDPSTEVELFAQDQFMIRALAIAEEKYALEKYINTRFPEMKRDSQKIISDEKTLIFIFANMAETGLYQPLLTHINTLPIDSKNRILLTHPHLLFPKRYLPLIEASAQKFKVQKEYILSIIRQESSFDPLARSGADAF